jgi:hypothetical protein
MNYLLRISFCTTKSKKGEDEKVEAEENFSEQWRQAEEDQIP